MSWLHLLYVRRKKSIISMDKTINANCRCDKHNRQTYFGLPDPQRVVPHEDYVVMIHLVITFWRHGFFFKIISLVNCFHANMSEESLTVRLLSYNMLQLSLSAMASIGPRCLDGASRSTWTRWAEGPVTWFYASMKKTRPDILYFLSVLGFP